MPSASTELFCRNLIWIIFLIKVSQDTKTGLCCLREARRNLLNGAPNKIATSLALLAMTVPSF